MSKGFNLTKKWFYSTKISNQIQCLFFIRIKFSCSDNITARNSKLNVTESDILIDVVGVLALV